MGCNVVTAYTDEAVGHMGYPQAIVTDLYDRNYCPGNLLKQVLTTHPYYIMGFNQSFAQTKLFTYVLNKKEYFIFSAGRFLVTMDCLTKTQKSMMHQDKIIALDVKGKLCLTATVGGRIILWDLQFFQQKINIKLSSQAINFSSIGFTQKYIFCTDIEQPNNNIYCYDLRTAKFRAKSSINSYEPTFKGVSWGSNHHVTAAADGLWFCKYIQNSSEIEITKGMFRIFPKTSMTSLCVVNEIYLISGSVDGYVFLWAHYQCQKVMKVVDSTIGQMILSKNKLIVSSFSDNVRVFQYTIKQKKDIQKDEKDNGEITQDFVSVIIDSYDKEPLQSICISKIDQSVYYCQTRNGVLFNKLIPSSDYQAKALQYKQMDKKIIQFEKSTQKYIYKDSIWLLKFRKQFFQLKKIETHGSPQNWKVNAIYVANAKKFGGSQENPLYRFIPQLNQVVYVGKDKVYVSDIMDIQLNNQMKIEDIKRKTILKFVTEGPQAINIIKIQPFQIKQKLFIIFYLEFEFFILKKQQQEWIKMEIKQDQNQSIKQIDIEGTMVKVQKKGNELQLIIPGKDQTLKDKMSFLHCVHQIQITNKVSNGKQISIGGGFALIK